MKKIITILVISLGIVSVAFAQGAASLYVTPATGTSTPGATKNITVGVNSNGKKVCAVEGKLALANGTLENITLSGDVIAQQSPTTSNPSFLLGIPGCSTGNKTLFTATVRTTTAGTSNVRFSNVDIIGEGKTLGSANAGASFTVNAPITVPVAPAPNTQNQNNPQNNTTNQDQPNNIADDVAAIENNVEVDDSSQIAQVSEAADTEGGNSPLWIILALVVLTGAILGSQAYLKKQN